MTDLEGLPLVLTIPEAAQVLRIGRSAAYAMARSGQLPTVRLGERTLRVPRHQLAELLGEEVTPIPRTVNPQEVRND